MQSIGQLSRTLVTKGARHKNADRTFRAPWQRAAERRWSRIQEDIAGALRSAEERPAGLFLLVKNSVLGAESFLYVGPQSGGNARPDWGLRL